MLVLLKNFGVFHLKNVIRLMIIEELQNFDMLFKTNHENALRFFWGAFLADNIQYGYIGREVVLDSKTA